MATHAEDKATAMATQAGDKAEQVGDSKALEVLARVGLVAYGVVHLLLGWLALQIAWGLSGRESADTSGAMKTLADQPFGQVLLWLVAVGLAALALWQASAVIWGYRNLEGAERVRKQITSGAKAVVFAALGYSAGAAALGAGSSSAQSQQQSKRFLELVPGVEKAIVDSGIILIKYWLEVSSEEQTRRLESRLDDPRKIWKLSDLDLMSYSRWYDYSRARDDMLAVTDTTWAPWYIAHTDDKKRARLNIITHLLGQVPYEPIPRKTVTLPNRDEPGDYDEPDAPRRYIPTPY
jgi:polyphosphate kinase 2 PPK2/uncharacterized protein DUF1206